MTSLQKKLNKLVKDGYVRVQRHPQLPLSIYTYTQKTEVERNWTPETLMARGLVLDDSGRIVINCVPKFFNIGQPGAENVAFEGSFESKYAQTARSLVLNSLHNNKLPEDILFCCELLMDFPGDEGIIVTRHGNVPKLKCWAVRFNDGSELFPTSVKLPSFLTPVESFTPARARKYLEKSGIEGVVLYDIDTQARVKVKTQEFIERHRFISNITPKNIW